LGMDDSYQELVEKYGEDNAKFLQETLCDHTRNYTRMTYRNGDRTRRPLRATGKTRRGSEGLGVSQSAG
jgi:hypothetical protein